MNRRMFLMNLAGACAGLMLPAVPKIFDMKPKRIVTPQEVADRILENAARFIVQATSPGRSTVHGPSVDVTPTLFRHEECVGVEEAVRTAASLANMTGGVAYITSPDFPKLNEAIISEPPPLYYMGGNRSGKSLMVKQEMMRNLESFYEGARQKCIDDTRGTHNGF